MVVAVTAVTIKAVPIPSVKMIEARVAVRWGMNLVMWCGPISGTRAPHATIGEGFQEATAVAGDAVTMRSIRCRNHGPRARCELEVSGEVP